MEETVALSLTADALKQLQSVVSRRCPEYTRLIVRSAQVSRSDVEELLKCVTLELMAEGLKADSEPNAYGLQLEALITELNRHGFR